MKRKARVGDRVTPRVGYCERDGQEGEIISVNTDPLDTMPIMVRFFDFGEWPFAEDELQNHTTENEEYEADCDQRFRA